MTDVFDLAPRLDWDPRVRQARLLLIARAHALHRPEDDLSFLLMSYQDFLLQLPSALERILIAERGGRNVGKLDIEPFERACLEARALQLRFEPWSEDYRVLVASLVSRQLLNVVIEGRRDWTVTTTDAGAAVAERLASSPAFSITSKRAEVVSKTLNVTTTTLRSYVERTLPSTVTLEEIAF